ncbi:MAG: PAS domain S-box protein [Cyanobacteria bacterium J06621_12]
MIADPLKSTPETADVFRAEQQQIIMLVDDNEIDRAVYRRYLKSKYQLIEAETGEEALEIYSQFQPDIILLDYLLPDLDGLEWLTLWQRQYSDSLCPVIVLTGQGDENIAVQFIKMGAADYFVKGQVTAEKLKLAVNNAIATKRLQQTNKDLIAKLTARNNKLKQINRLYKQEIAKRERYKEVIAHVPAVIYAKDIDRETQQSGKLWLANQEFQKIFALEEADVVGKTDQEIFPPHVADDLAANDRFVIDNKQPLTTQEQVYHADGELYTYLSFKFPLFDHQGEVTSIVGIATDITLQKQAQAKILASETRFRNTFEQAAVGIAHVAPDGKWLRVNQKLCQIIGYPKDELLQKTFQNITHPEDLDSDLKHIRQILAGEIPTYSLEKRYIRKDGANIWINLTVSLVRNSDGEPDYFISVIEDISNRKYLELSLQKTLKRLSNLHLIDRAILAAEHPQEIAKTSIGEIPKFIACQRISIVTFDWERETATVLATQGRGTQLAGNGFQVHSQVWQDLIEQLDKIDPQQNYLVAYLSHLPQLSQAVPALEAAGLDCFIGFPLQSRDNKLGILKLWVENKDIIANEDLAIVREVCDQLAIAIQQANLFQQVQNYTLELEARVTQRTAQLAEINQELKAFSYSISHDLKAPLRAIQGFATAIEEDYGSNLDDLGKEYTRRLVSSAQQMERLIQDLLAYSRLSRAEIQMQTIDLDRIVTSAIAQLEPEIAESQAQIAIDRPLLNILGNKTVLTQIVSNLLSNAIKFVTPGVVPQVQIKTEIKGDRLRLWVEDNGIGIETPHQDRIFHVFERLHGNEAYPGTGIGLAIVKKGMERLGGRFGVESSSDRGSRFWIEGKSS